MIFLRILKKPCFYENIEAWKYGPVVPNVYSEFKMYGSNDIPKILNYNYFERIKSWRLVSMEEPQNGIEEQV